MEIIKKSKLYITGLTGAGDKTGEVWSDFDNQYKEKTFAKADENGYEIRFSKTRRTGKEPDPMKNVHVGFLTECLTDSGYTAIELPESEYAVFNVQVARGYDSGNTEMEIWLADHSAIYGLREYKGIEYAVECYNEKFKDGDKPDSIVEIWLPLFRYCQSCYMPMTKPEEFGTETDGRPSNDYCCYCYADGDFTTKQNLEEAVEGNIQFWREKNDKSDDEARARIWEVFPKLKRWMN